MENVVGFVFVFQILRLLCVREVFIVCLGFLWGGTEHMKDIAL